MRKESNIRSKPTKILKLKAQTCFYNQIKAEGERKQSYISKSTTFQLCLQSLQFICYKGEKIVLFKK
jgi:hypothetical protein